MKLNSVYVYFVLLCCVGAIIGLQRPFLIENATTILYGYINVVSLISYSYVTLSAHKKILDNESVNHFFRRIVLMQIAIIGPYLCGKIEILIKGVYF